MAAPSVDTSASFAVHPAPGNKAASNGTSLNDLSKRKYIRWDAKGVEEVPPNEEADINEVADLINHIQRTHWNLHRHAYSGTHARTQGIVKGTFVVNDNLPSHLRQTELFAKSGQYPAVCRYSTEPGDPGQDDRIANPRGFAMKLFNVHGEMFDAGKDIPTHDIEFNSTPALDLADAKTTKEIIGLRVNHGHDKPELYKHLEKRKDTALQKARDEVHNTHLSSTRQYSQTAYRFGDYVMKFSLVPSTATQEKMYSETVATEHGSDILHRWLRDFHANNEAEYLFQVQLLEDLQEQPVEYAGKVWDPEKFPFQTVAVLKIPRQESFNYERKTFWEDHLRVDPWLGLKSWQPLGSPNRLRRVVYPRSSALRRKMNGRKEIHVTSIDDIA